MRGAKCLEARFIKLLKGQTCRYQLPVRVARDFSEMAIVLAMALPHHCFFLLGNWRFPPSFEDGAPSGASAMSRATSRPRGAWHVKYAAKAAQLRATVQTER